ncbi:MAG: fibronectin type III domain-containing protein, partial [Deltaproteobacteria bacterium]|nr:fibronectin type III domain-containing protein [Deltaproteobacteria bacterium]
MTNFQTKYLCRGTVTKKLGKLLSQFLPCSLLGLLSFVILTLVLTISATSAHSAELTLAWDPNAEQDIAGYKIYYKTESSGPPYNGTGLTEGNSPIDLGNQIEFTLHGLIDDVTYFFVATAYDTEGLESDYSEELVYGTGNHPPVADAGPEQTVNEGVAVTLDGSNSTDPDDGIASYLWEQTSGPSVNLSSADEVQSTFTAPDVGPNGESFTF